MSRNEPFDEPLENREEELFLEAIELNSDDERRSFLNNSCGADLELRQRLEQLVAAHLESNDLVDNPSANLTFVRDPIAAVRFGEFEVVRELGRGGMGIVYEAVQTTMRRHVALKVLPIRPASSVKAVDRFHREVVAAGRLQHPNIIAVYLSGGQDDFRYYAMDLVRGPSLDDVLNYMREHRGTEFDRETANERTASTGNTSCDTTIDKLNVDDLEQLKLEQSARFATEPDFCVRIARLFAAVAKGLHHAHEQHVIHRDIKPSNLLLAPDGRLCISDFGLAQLIDEPSCTVTHEMLGSPRYMSPEQVTGGSGPIDPRTDIYSLGVTLYEVLTLRPAFCGEKREQVLDQVLRAEPVAPRQINPAVPLDLQTICLRAMEKSPDRRYATASDLADDLQRFANRLPIVARPIGLLERGARHWRRHVSRTATRWLVAGSLMLVASLFAWQRLAAIRDAADRYSKARQSIVESMPDATWEARVKIQEATEAFPDQKADLNVLLTQFCDRFEVESEPPGAEISLRPSNDDGARWLSIGTTPLVAQIPTSDAFFVRARIVGRDEIIFWHETDSFSSRQWKLKVPREAGMIDTPAYNGDVARYRIAWLGAKRVPTIAAFQIDRCEVSNREYQQFVDAGGYSNRDYWIDQLGEEWQQHVSKFLDSTEKPGPRFWADGKCPNPASLEDPVVGVSWYEAMAYAKYAHKQLPTLFHCLYAMGYNANDDAPVEWLRKHSNIAGRSYSTRPRTAGRLNVSTFGVEEMLGNVKEWCLNEEGSGQRFAMGGSFRDDDDACYASVVYAPDERRDDIGFRCARYPDSAELTAAQPITWRKPPALPQSLEHVRDLFWFDQGLPFNESPPELTRFHGVNAQRLQFDAPYGVNERITCYLLLPDPTRFAPPYQVVVGTSPMVTNKVGRLGLESDYLIGLYQRFVDQGRAAVLPGFWGNSPERTGSFSTWYPDLCERSQYIEGMSRVAKDIVRTTDFLCAYNQLFGTELLDSQRLSMLVCGRACTVVPLVADKLVSRTDRYKAVFFSQGGLMQCDYPPEVDPWIFSGFITTPAIFVNRRRDSQLTYVQSQEFMYDRLPLIDRQQKARFIDPTAVRRVNLDHVDREVSSWFNRWLGTPRRATPVPAE